jgi:hypothetical protein
VADPRRGRPSRRVARRPRPPVHLWWSLREGELLPRGPALQPGPGAASAAQDGRQGSRRVRAGELGRGPRRHRLPAATGHRREWLRVGAALQLHGHPGHGQRHGDGPAVLRAARRDAAGTGHLRRQRPGRVHRHDGDLHGHRPRGDRPRAADPPVGARTSSTASTSSTTRWASSSSRSGYWTSRPSVLRCSPGSASRRSSTWPGSTPRPGPR